MEFNPKHLRGNSEGASSLQRAQARTRRPSGASARLGKAPNHKRKYHTQLKAPDIDFKLSTSRQHSTTPPPPIAKEDPATRSVLLIQKDAPASNSDCAPKDNRCPGQDTQSAPSGRLQDFRPSSLEQLGHPFPGRDLQIRASETHRWIFANFRDLHSLLIHRNHGVRPYNLRHSRQIANVLQYLPRLSSQARGHRCQASILPQEEVCINRLHLSSCLT